MVNKTRKTKITIGVAVAAAALVCVPVVLAQGAAASPAALRSTAETAAATGRQGAEAVYSVKTAPAETRTLESFLEVNGDVVSGGQVAVLAETPGKVVAVYGALGTPVRKGDLIALIDPSSVGTQYMTNGVYAPISGILCADLSAVGSTVQAGSVITGIAPEGAPHIESRIPERSVGALRVGLAAKVTLPAFPGEVFAATVTQVSPILDAASRTKKIVLTLNQSDSRVNAGMFARVTLGTHRFPDVLTVPSEALASTPAAGEGSRSGAAERSRSVFVYQDGRVTLREVETGVTVEGFTEVKSGLAAGEMVVVQGQQFLAEGVAVLLR